MNSIHLKPLFWRFGWIKNPGKVIQYSEAGSLYIRFYRNLFIKKINKKNDKSRNH